MQIPKNRDIDTLAAEWLLKIETQPNDSELNDGLAAWLSQSEDHQLAWKRVTQSWALLGEVDVDRSQWPKVQVDKKSPFSLSLKKLLPLAVAACFLVAVLPMINRYINADYITGNSQLQTVKLEDGSQVFLGADSAFEVNFTESQRHIRLLSGEAFFEVTPDKNKPFVVSSNALKVTVLGTAFNVEVNNVQSRVGVEHGHVEVETATGHYDLRAGQLVAINHENQESRQWHTLAENIGAWRDGHLFVRGRTIADLVSSLQRYDKGLIVVTDEQLGSKTVTGSYQLDNVDQVLEAIIEPHGGKVIHVTPLLTILTSQ